MIKAPELEPGQVVALVEKMIGYQGTGNTDGSQDEVTIPYAGHLVSSLEALLGANNVAGHHDVWKCVMAPPKVANQFDVDKALRVKMLGQVLVQCGLLIHSKADAVIELQPKEAPNVAP